MGWLRRVGITGGLALACWLAAGVFIYAQEPIVQPGGMSRRQPPLRWRCRRRPQNRNLYLGRFAVSVEMTPATGIDGSALGPHLDAPAVSPVGLDASAGYTVRTGDTLFTVALEMGLDLNDVPCAIAPDFTVAQPLVIGNKLYDPAGEYCVPYCAGGRFAGFGRTTVRQQRRADIPAAVEQTPPR